MSGFLGAILILLTLPVFGCAVYLGYVWYGILGAIFLSIGLLSLVFIPASILLGFQYYGNKNRYVQSAIFLIGISTSWWVIRTTHITWNSSDRAEAYSSWRQGIQNTSDRSKILTEICTKGVEAVGPVQFEPISAGTVYVVRGFWGISNVSSQITRDRLVNLAEAYPSTLICEDEYEYVQIQECRYVPTMVIRRRRAVGSYRKIRLPEVSVVEQRVFSGPDPGPCPVTTGNSGSREGGPIKPEDFAAWATQ